MATKDSKAVAADIAADPAEMQDRSDPETTGTLRVDAPARNGEAASPSPFQPVPVEGPFDGTREAIADRYRALRDEDEANAAAALAEHQAAKEVQQLNEEPDPGQGTQPPARVKVVIDGREEFVPL